MWLNKNIIFFVFTILYLLIPSLVAAQLSCNNWLRIPNSQSYVTIGDMDIAGTQITVEGLFSRDSAFTPEGYTSLNVVSKHWTPSDINYLLRVDRAQVTTTNGHFMTPEICDLVNKKLYHVAMTYDGAVLKFYRNGFLMSQVPCTGDMFQNDYLTTIAATANSPTTNTQLIGYLNEIRIWNVVKTQAQLQQYMSSPIPNPVTQPGLSGYYTFETLTNKQGNNLYNATLHGNASINEVIPDCNFLADSCITDTDPTEISGIINNYAAVIIVDPCNNTITTNDASAFNPGDTIVIMQMKGASIDSSNTINFGSITNYNNAGKYEFNYVKSKTGNTIECRNTFLNSYDAVAGKIQLIRVPYFQTLTVTDTLTCTAWDGTKGGVLIVNSATEVNLNAPIDVSIKGFRGGQVGGGFSCGKVSDWAMATGDGGMKGEGITEYIAGFEAGGARLANGGGGAYAANSGGGGGGNYGAGGIGGFHSNTCPSPTQSINGQGLDYTTLNRVFLGGGGGGGQQDNNAPVAAGGNGGGIVIMKAATLNSNNQTITANGETINTLVQDEGGAGGGAGGSIILFVNNYTGRLNANLNGGDGSSNNNQIYPTRCHGPGGGGGGGHFGILTNGILPPAEIVVSVNGGRAGTIQNNRSICFPGTNGATDGTSGDVAFNLVISEATIPFTKNIDSVRIKDSLTGCKTFDFKGIAFINTTPIQKWEWNFGDGNKGNSQNVSHTYPGNGAYTVQLTVTDANGCRDSISKRVTTSGLLFDFTFQQDICNPLSVTYTATGESTPEIFWALGDGTEINAIRNPQHTYTDTGTYLIQYSTGNISSGCVDTIKKIIFIGWRNDNIVTTPNDTICVGEQKKLRSSIDEANPFCWSPDVFLDDITITDPVSSTPSNITYSLFAYTEGSNLVTNGNFENGNTGFTSQSIQGTKPLSTAQYIVTNSSTGAGPGTTGCTDLTSGTGNMLMVRNDYTKDIIVWQQKVNVLPQNNYIFSGWVQTIAAPINTDLQLVINGTPVSNNFLTASGSCVWVKQSVNWNSGANSTADIAIISKASNNGRDDYFAVDEISFAPFLIKKDTVSITIDTPDVNTIEDTVICSNASIQLATTGANTYVWTPATGLSDIGIADPMASPVADTRYVVTGTSVSGCIATDSVTITVKPSPVITSTGDTLICRNTGVTLFATGGGRYAWSPAALLNNADTATPTANATITNTEYVVAVTGINNCVSKDSFTVNVKPIPSYSISADKAVCLNTKPQLNATGGNFYLWSPASLVSNAAISNPLAVTNDNTLYSVLIRDTACGNDTTLTTAITILPLPTVTAAKENDINCALGTAQLNAAGAVQYNWTPAATLNDATSPTPIASNINTTTYIVKGTDADGCSNTATVTVLADYSDKVSYAVPNAFSPNGDDKNDCFSVKYFGLITELQFAIYNRYGEKVFFTTNPNDCWDGMYKGSPCSSGSFVYYIKAKTTCGSVERKGSVLLLR